MRRAWCALSFVAVASCAPRVATPVGERWDAMSKERKLEYMNTTVMPRMKAAFVNFDPHRYAKIDCATCHGRDGAERGYTKNPDLLLEPTPWNTASADPATAPSPMDAFMAGVVAKEMGGLVGRPVGCFGCHTPER